MVNSVVTLDEAAFIDKRLQTYQGTVATLAVEREVVVMGDPATFGDTNEGIARVLNAAPVSTDYGLVVRNIPSGTQTVSGTVTGNQGTPAVTANRWPVQITDGTDLALVSTAGALIVDGSAVTQPVSGTVTANAGTGTFITDPSDRAARLLGVLSAGANNIGDVDVLTSVNSATRVASGALAALNNAVTVNSEGAGIIHFEIDTGTLVGTVVTEATLDDTNFFSVNVIQNDGTISSSFTAFGIRGVFVTGGYSQVRLRVSAFTSGTSNARLEASSGAAVVRLGQGLPAGTNNIGDVDVLTLPALVAGTANIGDVDIASPLGAGSEAAAVRVTVATDSTGVLSVDDNAGSLTVDAVDLDIRNLTAALDTVVANAGTGTFTVSGTVTAAQTVAANLKAEVVGLTADNAVNPTAKLAVLVGVANAAAPTRTEGNVNPLRLNLAGDVAVTLDSEAVVLGTGAAVIGALTANQSVNLAQVAGIATTAGGGVELNTLRVTIANDSTGLVSVDDNAGSLTVDAVDLDIRNLVAATDIVSGVGLLAHDAINTASNNPAVGGMEAIAHGTNPTAVAAADVTKWYANRHGIPFVIGGHMNPFTEESQITAAQTDLALKTVATGTRIAITRISVTADKANTVDVGYRLGFGLVSLPVGGTGVAGILSSHPGVAAGSGVIEGNGGAILGIGADDADLRITNEVPTTGSIRVVVSGFTIES